MILLYITLFFLALPTLRHARDFYKRFKLIRSLRELERETGCRLTVHQSPYKSIFKLSAKTEMTFETTDTAYHIRLMSSFGFYKRIVHFASPEYIVSFRRFKFILIHGSANVAISHGFVHQDGFNYGCRVRRVPKHVRVLEVEGKKNIDVFLFNPTPHTVSYVTPEKTSIRMARVDADIYGNRVFTASTFCEFIRGELVARSAPSSETPTRVLAPKPLKEKALDSYTFTPPSDSDFDYAVPKEPLEEYTPLKPEERSREIVWNIKKWLILLSSMELAFLAFFFVAFFAFNRNGTLLFFAVLLLAVNAALTARINSRLHLFLRRGSTYEATVVGKAVHTPIRRGNTLNYPAYVYHVYPEGYLKPNEPNRFGGAFSITVLDSAGKRHRSYLATKKHFDL